MEVSGTFFHPAALPPPLPGEDPDAHWIGGWLGPQTPSGRSKEAINSFLLSGFEHFIVQSTDLSLNWLKLLKEAITNWLSTLRQYLSYGLRKSRITSIRAEIWTETYKNTKQACPNLYYKVLCLDVILQSVILTWRRKNINSRNVVY